MTSNRGSEYEEVANSARRVGNLERAGEYYTRTTFEYLGANGLNPAGYASKGLMYLLLGAICYRVGGQDSRATYRCRQGIALATDLSDQACVGPRPSYDYDAAERGVWDEFAGDFRVVGEIAPPEEAYEDARLIYRDAGDPRIGLAEQMPMAAIANFRRLVLAANGDIDEFNRKERSLTFTEWIDYKIETLPDCLETVIESGTFQWRPTDSNQD